jgi:tetratricopeptide (TPR) repeat protein
MKNTKTLVCALLLSPFAGSSQTIIQREQYTGTKSDVARKYYSEGTSALDARQFKNAIAPLRAAVAEDHNYIDAYDNLGVAYRNLNQLDSAEYFYRESIRRYPKGVVALVNLGKVSERRGNFTQALEYYKQAVAIKPDDAESYFSLMRGYSLLKKFPEALENGYKAEQYYKKANSPYIGDCYLLMCVINIQTNKMEEARKYRDLAKATGKTLPPALADALK